MVVLPILVFINMRTQFKLKLAIILLIVNVLIRVHLLYCYLWFLLVLLHFLFPLLSLSPTHIPNNFAGAIGSKLAITMPDGSCIPGSIIHNEFLIITATILFMLVNLNFGRAVVLRSILHFINLIVKVLLITFKEGDKTSNEYKNLN